jgi:hypothetical protein
MCDRPAKFGCVDMWLDCATFSGNAYAQLSARSAASAYAQLSRALCNARPRTMGSGLGGRRRIVTYDVGFATQVPRTLRARVSGHTPGW